MSVGAAIVGLGLAWRAYAHAGKDYKEPIAETAPPLYKVLYNKWFVDEGYDYVFTGRRKVGDVRLGVLGLGEASSWFDSQGHRRRRERCWLGNARGSHAFLVVG